MIMENSIQIDVMESKQGMIRCNLYTDGRCVPMYLPQHDYDQLVKDGFFIRDGKEKDSANVLNTTKEYKLWK